MSNPNNNLQTQTSNALHNANMEACGKDSSPMLAPEDIRSQLDAEAQAVQIILIGIDNDIYTTVDTCSNACEMWKAIERFYKMMNELVRNKCNVTNHQVNVQFLLQLQPEWQRPQQAATRNRGKAIVNSPPPTYDQEPKMVAEDDALSKEKDIDKLTALISLSLKKIYKPTNNNLRTSSNTSRANQDNTPRINKGTGYDNQKTVNVTGATENVGTQVVQQSRIQCYNYKKYGHIAKECQKPKRAKDAAYHKEKMLLYQKLEAHYLYMTQIQEVTPEAVDNSGPIYDVEPLQKVQNDNDNYYVFANDSEHPEQHESVNVTYIKEHDDTNITTDPLDMSINGGEADHDDDENLARERDLLASLIDKLKCEIDDNKNCNKLLESSNKTLVDKLKDLKKFQAELDEYHDVNYMSKVEIDFAKAKERAEVYYECKEPFKSLKSLWVRSKSIVATWLEKVVTPLIEPAIKGFAAASAVLKPERLKVDRHGMSEPMSYYLID
nr:hypothetical protein [Tanacetum cinerariifolium]